MATDFDALKAIAQENDPSIISGIGTPGYPANGATDWSPVVAAEAASNEAFSLAQNQILIGQDASSGIANPTTAPTVTTVGTGGSLLNGTYQVSYSYTDAHGHTAGSPNGTAIFISAGSTYKIHVAALTLPSGVTGVDWFVSAVAGGSTQKLYGHNSTGAAFDIISLPLGTPTKPTSNTTATSDHAVKKELVAGTGIDIVVDDSAVTINATGDASVDPATTTTPGVVVTSYTPADPDNPKVLGFDDPLVDLIPTVDRVSSTNDPDAGFVFKVSSFDSGTDTGVGSWQLIAPSGSSLPSTGTALEGDLFFKTTDSHLYYFHSGAWVDVSGSGGGGGSSTLTDGHIFVGDGSNVATDVAMSGDVTIDNTGVTTIANSSVTPGSYTNASITVGADGRLTAASNGSGGSASTIANGSSFPGSPSTDDQFIRNDLNKLYRYDGATWVELTSGGGGGGTSSGTTFPGSPSVNDHFIRTDRNNTEFYWNGTYWLTEEYHMSFISRGAQPFSTTTYLDIALPDYAAWGGFLINKISGTFFPNSNQSGSNYYTLTCNMSNFGGTYPAITFSANDTTQSGTAAGTWYPLVPTFTPIAFTSHASLLIGTTMTPTGSPGSLYIAMTVTFQKIG